MDFGNKPRAASRKMRAAGCEQAQKLCCHAAQDESTFRRPGS